MATDLAKPRQVALAVSGGGYRASAWGTGAMLAVSDLRHDGHVGVASCSSVSGGSIANAVLGHKGLFSAPRNSTDEEVRRFIRGLTDPRAGFKFGIFAIAIAVATATMVAWRTAVEAHVVAGVLVGATLIIGVAAARRCDDIVFGFAPTWLAIAGLCASLWIIGASLVSPSLGLEALVGAALFASIALALRGHPIQWSIGWYLRTGRASPSLDSLDPTVDHVICATELRGGHQVYAGSDFLYSFDHGVTTEVSRIKLARVVQWSACLPLAFPPRLLIRSALQSRYLVIVDGGVYDNMADQWSMGLADRRSDDTPNWNDHDLVVVANGSQGLTTRKLRSSLMPWPISDFPSIPKVIDVLYDNGNSLRRQHLIYRFDRGDPDGALVHIATNPFLLPQTIAAGQMSRDVKPSADQQRRALVALTALTASDAGEEEWATTAKANSKIGTKLNGLHPDQVHRLIHHSYVLTKVNMFVLHGIGDVRDLPTSSELRQRLTEPCSALGPD